MQVKCLEQKGEYENALAALQKNEKYFVDQVQREDFYGRLYHKTKNSEKATFHYENLLELNSCNFETYYKIINVKGVVLFDQYKKPKILNAEE